MVIERETREKVSDAEDWGIDSNRRKHGDRGKESKTHPGALKLLWAWAEWENSHWERNKDTEWGEKQCVWPPWYSEHTYWHFHLTFSEPPMAEDLKLLTFCWTLMSIKGLCLSGRRTGWFVTRGIAGVPWPFGLHVQPEPTVRPVTAQLSALKASVWTQNRANKGTLNSLLFTEGNIHTKYITCREPYQQHEEKPSAGDLMSDSVITTTITDHYLSVLVC